MAKQHLLLVDSDAKSLRVMEVSLKKAGFSVTTAIHGRDALEKVQISSPDLVLADTKMPEMDGFELCRALKSDDRLRNIPFVFLTNQKSVEFKVKGLELGGDDYLTKPIYIKEIVTRVKMILQKAEKERIEKRETKGGFSGNLSDMGVVDLVQTFEIGRKTGTISLEGEHARGAIYFREGKVIDAELGRLAGENAFYRMLNTFEGKFDVQFSPVDRADRIGVSTQGLLMEGMRRLDDWGRMLEQIPPLETVFEVDPRQLADRLSEIPDEVNGLLRLFDGKRSLSRVVEESDFEDLSALGIISKLYFEGLIRELGSVAAEAAPPKPGIEEWLQGPAILNPAPLASLTNSALNGSQAAAPREEPEVPPDVAFPAVQPPRAPDPVVASQGPASVIVFAPRRTSESRTPVAAEPLHTPVVPPPVPVATSPGAPEPPALAATALPRAMDRAKQAFLLEWAKDDSEGGGLTSPAWEFTAGWSPAAAFATVPAPPEAPPPPAPPTTSSKDNGATRRALSPSTALPPYMPVPPPPPIAAFAPEPIPLSNPEPIPLSNPEPIPLSRAEPIPPSPPPSPRGPMFGGAAGESRPLPPPSAVIVSPVPLTPPQFPNLLPTPPPMLAQPATVPLPAPVAAPLDPEPAPRRAPEIVSGEPLTPAIDPPAGVAVLRPEDRFFNPPGAAVPEDRRTAPAPGRRRMAPLWIGIGVGAVLAGIWAIAATGDRGPPAALPPEPPPAAVVAPAPTPEPPQLPSTSPAPPAIAATPPAPAAVPQPEPPAPAPAPTAPAPPPASDAEPDFAKLVRQGNAALQGERFASAAKAFRAALAQKPDSLEAKTGLGVALVNQGTGYKEAVKLLQEAVQADDGNAKVWLSLGMAHQFTGASGQAREAYKKYLLLAPTGEAAGDVRAMLKELGP